MPLSNARPTGSNLIGFGVVPLSPERVQGAVAGMGPVGPLSEHFAGDRLKQHGIGPKIGATQKQLGLTLVCKNKDRRSSALVGALTDGIKEIKRRPVATQQLGDDQVNRLVCKKGMGRSEGGGYINLLPTTVA
jgi:hypothetical protein